MYACNIHSSVWLKIKYQYYDLPEKVVNSQITGKEV